MLYVIKITLRYIHNNVLISDCSFAITTNEELSIQRLALSIAHQNDSDVITAATVFNSSDIYKLTDAVIVHRDHAQSVNTINESFCHISSLEVYRGRQKAIEIAHSGFYLSHRGTIVVITQLEVMRCFYNIMLS